uniref:RNA polymerase II-associated protein 1 N-terminal domain-containing protein n=1 Tax=Romanomermis culicivorax TaxID=13658 RepID=A0A915HX11_ROMCU
MIKRPTRVDNEYDLLREQEEFLKNPQRDIGVRLIKQKKRNLVHQTTVESARIVQDQITEKLINSDFNFQFEQFFDENRGFPPVFDVDPDDTGSIGCSLFLKYLPEKISSKVDRDSSDLNSPERYSAENVPYSDSLTPFSRLKHEIHLENMTKLHAMCVNEIMEEQKMLIKKLDPQLVKFIKSRRNKDSESTHC